MWTALGSSAIGSTWLWVTGIFFSVEILVTMPVLHSIHCWPFKNMKTSLLCLIISVQLKAEVNDVAGFVVTLVWIFHQINVAIDTKILFLQKIQVREFLKNFLFSLFPSCGLSSKVKMTSAVSSHKTSRCSSASSSMLLSENALLYCK